MKRFDGKKLPDRRGALESAIADGFVPSVETGEGEVVSGFQEYRKTTTILAVRIDEPFEVDTLEGLHSGKAGDYLAVGVAGEMYPIDGAVMAASYEAVK